MTGVLAVTLTVPVLSGVGTILGVLVALGVLLIVGFVVRTDIANQRDPENPDHHHDRRRQAPD